MSSHELKVFKQAIYLRKRLVSKDYFLNSWSKYIFEYSLK